MKDAASLTRKLREQVTSDKTDEQKNNYWAGYAEGLLTALAADIPEVRKELESRVLYNVLHP